MEQKADVEWHPAQNDRKFAGACKMADQLDESLESELDGVAQDRFFLAAGEVPAIWSEPRGKKNVNVSCSF